MEKVGDASGEPLLGVSVKVKGTGMGTVTNVDGIYNINVSQKSTLIFSFIGMATQEVKVGNKTTINVTLEDDAALLDEVVVVGYGTQKK